MEIQPHYFETWHQIHAKINHDISDVLKVIIVFLSFFALSKIPIIFFLHKVVLIVTVVISMGKAFEYFGLLLDDFLEIGLYFFNHNAKVVFKDEGINVYEKVEVV